MNLTGLERYMLFTKCIEESYKLVQKIKADHMMTFGLRGTDTTLLFVLGLHKDGLTATELASKCNVDKSVISRAIGTLCDTGAVKYLDDGKKNYRSRLVLSEKGESLFHAMSAIAEEAADAATADLSAEDMHQFYQVLFTLNYNLSEYAKGNES